MKTSHIFLGEETMHMRLERSPPNSGKKSVLSSKGQKLSHSKEYI